jgi:hypothetical protein
MVMVRCIGWAALLVSCCVWSADKAESMAGKATALTLSPLVLPQIRAVEVKENGATSPAAGEPDPQCKSFRLSKANVIEYLRRAQLVSEHDYFHALDWSPCFASGNVYFEGGLKGVWGVQQYRAGSLKLSDGREFYLYCTKCKARHFL